MSGSEHIARNHSHNGLAKTRGKVIGLNDQRWAPLRGQKVGIGEQDENDITPAAIRHKLTFRDDPSPQKRQLICGAGPQPGSHRCCGREG